ncbi:MAG: endonuclease/exonuclease/phosphatase family protein [Rickettsiales bacterium]|nr:endonuclease/exonuclease/phosphatase family protein [Rickettsiales bacterium]
MGNLGYLRGINGSLVHHIAFAHRYFYCTAGAQAKAVQQLKAIIEREVPDVCCFVEIDQGSGHSAHVNQLEHVVNEHYRYFDIDNKYGADSPLRKFSLTRGKSNAFISRRELPFERLHFTHGTKRLIYKLQLEGELTLFFSHFSLNRKVRHMQLMQIRQLIRDTPGEVIFLGDFNILDGFVELAPLLQDELVLMNREDSPTFTFHKSSKVLDICLATPGVAKHIDLRIIPQPYSDHAALLVEICP